jgi:hypothetical protein
MSGRERSEDAEVDSTGPQDRRNEFLRSRGMDDDESFYRSSTSTPDKEDRTSDETLEQPREPENDEEGP